ncbi:MAG: hypothetical protein IRY90_12545 [Actinomadura rubrobrunea]|nr:hypothetical protein [Actinomadura rubrobrunea]
MAAAADADARGGERRLVRALLPAAVGGFAALTVSGVTALTVAAVRGRAAAVRRVVAALVVLSLPWLVPGVLRSGGVPGDGGAVEAFAARADTPFGTLGSLLLLGGVWNGETVPTAYGNVVTAGLWLAVVLAALFAYGRWCADGPWKRGLAGAAAVGFAVAALGAVAAPVLRGLIELWSGFAVLRDGQQFVAPLAVVVAVGLGVAAERAAHARLGIVTAGAVLAPLVLLPSLAWGAAGQLRAVQYPADWKRARDIVRADDAPGAVLLLPWAAYRSPEWNHGRRVLDPLPRYLHRRVVMNDAVTVDGTTVPPEDPRAIRLDALIRSGAPLTEALRREGVRYVAVDDPANADDDAGRRLAGAETVLDGRDLVLYRIPGAAEVRDDRVPTAAVAGAWIITTVAIVWSCLGARITLGTPLLARNLRRRVD